MLLTNKNIQHSYLGPTLIVPHRYINFIIKKIKDPMMRIFWSYLLDWKLDLE